MSDSESFGSAKEVEEPDFDALKASEDDGSDFEPLASKATPKKKSSKSPKKNAKKKITKASPKKNKKSSPARGKGKKKVPEPDSDVEEADEEESDPLALPKGKRGRPAKVQEEEEYEVESIVGHREFNGKLKYKIRWKNYGPKDDTWEEHSGLSCPDLLEIYNLKHGVKLPKKFNAKKRKAVKKSTPKKTKKRKSSVSEESDRDEDEEVDDEELCDDMEGDEYEVERIVEIRLKKDGAREFYVKWKRWGPEYNTWEPEENLSCPELIESFMIKLDNAKNSTAHELRADRKHTDRFSLDTQAAARRLSKRGNNKQRVKYHDAEGDESE